jgi:transposase
VVSDKAIEILELAAQGMTSKAIANAAGVPIGSVYSIVHRYNDVLTKYRKSKEYAEGNVMRFKQYLDGRDMESQLFTKIRKA